MPAIRLDGAREKKMHDKDMKHSDKMYAHKDILNNENVYLTSHHFPSNAKRGQNEKLENIKVECEGVGEEQDAMMAGWQIDSNFR